MQDPFYPNCFKALLFFNLVILSLMHPFYITWLAQWIDWKIRKVVKSKHKSDKDLYFSVGASCNYKRKNEYVAHELTLSFTLWHLKTEVSGLSGGKEWERLLMIAVNIVGGDDEFICGDTRFVSEILHWTSRYTELKLRWEVRTTDNRNLRD